MSAAFRKFSSLDAQVRSEGAILLLSALEGAPAEELALAVERLLKGMTSSNGCARQGFSGGMTAVLKQFGEDIINPIKSSRVQLLNPKNASTPQEKRDIAFAEIFLVLAFVRAGFADKVSVPQVELLLKLSQEMSWSRELCFAVLVELTRQLSDERYRSVHELLVAEISEAVSKSKLSADHITLAAAVVARQEDEPMKVNGLEYTQLRSAKDLKQLRPLLLDTVTAHPRVHSVWTYVLDSIFDEKTLKSKPAKVARFFGKFWKEIVEDGLLTSTNHRKFLALNLIQKTLTHPRFASSPMPDSVLEVLFSSRVMFVCLERSVSASHLKKGGSKKSMPITKQQRKKRKHDEISEDATVSVEGELGGRGQIHEHLALKCKDLLVAAANTSASSAFVALNALSKLQNASASEAPKPNKGKDKQKPTKKKNGFRSLAIVVRIKTEILEKLKGESGKSGVAPYFEGLVANLAESDTSESQRRRTIEEVYEILRDRHLRLSLESTLTLVLPLATLALFDVDCELTDEFVAFARERFLAILAVVFTNDAQSSASRSTTSSGDAEAHSEDEPKSKKRRKSSKAAATATDASDSASSRAFEIWAAFVKLSTTHELRDELASEVSTIVDALRGVCNSLESSISTEDSNDDDRLDAQQSLALRQLLVFFDFQVLCGNDEAFSIVAEFLESWKESSSSPSMISGAVLHTALQLCELDSHTFRFLSKNIFRAFAPLFTPPMIKKLITAVRDPNSKQGGDEDSDMEDDDEFQPITPEELKKMQEDNSSEESDDDDEEEESDDEVEEKSKSSGSDNDDDEGEGEDSKYAKALASAVRMQIEHRENQKRATKEASRMSANRRLRVAELVEVYCRSQHSNPHIIEVFVPLLKYLCHHTDGPVVTRVRKVFADVCSEKRHPRSGVSLASMQDILPELLRVKNVPPALYPVVTNGCFRLIRIFLACFSLASSENDPQSPRKWLSVQIDTSLKRFFMKKTQHKLSFFAELISRFPQLVWPLRETLTQHTSVAGNDFLRVATATLASALIKRVVQTDTDRSEISKYLPKVFECYAGLFATKPTKPKNTDKKVAIDKKLSKKEQKKQEKKLAQRNGKYGALNKKRRKDLATSLFQTLQTCKKNDVPKFESRLRKSSLYESLSTDLARTDRRLAKFVAVEESKADE